MGLEAVKALFGTFRSSDRRPQLYATLLEFLGHARAVGFVKFVIIDGSFVTSAPDPGDIDLIVAVDPAIFEKDEWKPHEYNVLSSKTVKRRYPFDVFVVPEGDGAYDEYLGLFSKVKGSDVRLKGVVRIRL